MVFLLLLAKLSLYAAELNPVLARRLYPRALPMSNEPTDADREVLAYIVRAEQRRKDQVIGVGFGDQAADDAATDARRDAPQKPALRRNRARPARPGNAAGWNISGHEHVKSVISLVGRLVMKPDIHPDYHSVVFRDRSADFAFLTRSTLTSDRTIEWEDGNTYPVVDVEISSASHPFYTGKSRVVDTAGRVEQFRRRYGDNPGGNPAATDS